MLQVLCAWVADGCHTFFRWKKPSWREQRLWQKKGEEREALTMREMRCCSSWVKREMGQDVRTTVIVSRISTSFSCTQPLLLWLASRGCCTATPPVFWLPRTEPATSLPPTDPRQVSCTCFPPAPSTATGSSSLSSLRIFLGGTDHCPGSCCCRLPCARCRCCWASLMLQWSFFLFVADLLRWCPRRCESRDVHSVCVNWVVSRESRSARWRYRHDTKASSSARHSSLCEKQTKTASVKLAPIFPTPLTVSRGDFQLGSYNIHCKKEQKRNYEALTHQGMSIVALTHQGMSIVYSKTSVTID